MDRAAGPGVSTPGQAVNRDRAQTLEQRQTVGACALRLPRGDHLQVDHPHILGQTEPGGGEFGVYHHRALTNRTGAGTITPMSDFMLWLESKVRSLEEEDSHLANTERGIGDRRRAIAEQLAHLRDTWTMYQAEAGGSSAVLPTLIPGRSRMTIAEATEAYLREHGGEARTADLVAVLQKSGTLNPASKNGYNIVQNTLSRRTDLFARGGRGVWKLLRPTAVEPNGSH